MVNITVQVVYAAPQTPPTLLRVTVPEGSSVAETLELSGIYNTYPDLQRDDLVVGVFSRKVALTDKVVRGDRIEIYRPLQIDPKTARVKRVVKKPRKPRGQFR